MGTFIQRYLSKGILNSSAINEIHGYILKEMQNLAEAQTTNEDIINKNMQALLTENIFLQDKIKELEDSLYNLKSRIDTELGLTYLSKLRQRFTGGAGIVKMDTGYIDPVYNYATIKPSASPIVKTSIVDNLGKVFIPDELQVTVTKWFDDNTAAGTVTNRSNDSTIDNMFDRKQYTYWIDTITTSDSVSTLKACIHIKLPTNIMNNALVNTIKLNPYPEYGLNIDSIEYKGYNEEWTTVSVIPDGGIKGAGKSAILIAPTNVLEVKVYVSQPTSIVSGTNKTFTLGMQEISIEYNQVLLDQGEIVVMFQLPAGKYFSQVSTPTAVVHPYAPQNIAGLVEFKLYYNADLVDEFPFGRSITSNIGTVYIKIILRQRGGVLPVLSAVELNYLPK